MVEQKGKMVLTGDEHATPSTAAPAGLYVALGDSITAGVGIKKNCSPFPTHAVDIEAYCPDGQSYAILTAKALRAAGIAGHFMNLGIGGAHLEKIISDELPYLPADATIVTLYIGTNDSRSVKSAKQTVASVVALYEKQFDEVVAAIHAKAPRARIVLINFPNQKYLAASYGIAPEILPLYDEVSQTLATFINTHYPAYTVVDTICSAASYDEAMRYKSSVHPNEVGAALLADRLIKVIEAKSPPPPPASCQWYESKPSLPDTKAGIPPTIQ